MFNFNYKENRVIYKVGVSIRYTQSSKTNGYVTTLYLSNDDNSRLGYSVVLDELKKEINNSVSQWSITIIHEIIEKMFMKEKLSNFKEL